MARLVIAILLIFVAIGLSSKTSVEIVVPGACISEVKKGPAMECRGADKTHLVCTGILITYIPECEKLEIRH